MKDNHPLRIAVVGVFDLDNYGDHLFPVIIEKYLLSKDISAEIVLYSIFEKEEGFKTGKHICSIYNMESDHCKNPFDAIIVAGGEIIHFGHFKHILEGKEIAYPIYGHFIAASILSAKYGIPLAWNNPGVPFQFELQYQTIMREALRSVDYISVRNQTSVNWLQKLGEEYASCRVSVDTAFAMTDIFRKQDFGNKTRRLGLPDSYILFHFNKMVSEEDAAHIEDAIRKLRSMGKNVVLLPIAYTNGDREFLSGFAENHNDICTCISNELSLKEFVAVLGSCELYVGLSFHGAITALSYGKPIVAIDYFRQPKTIDLFQYLDLDEFYLDSCERLYHVCTRALASSGFDKNVKRVKNEVHDHFDRMFQCLFDTPPLYLSPKNPTRHHKKECSIESVTNMISDISDRFQKQQYSLDVIRKENAELKEIERELRVYVDTLKLEREQLLRSYSWRITRPLRAMKRAFSKLKKWISSGGRCR